MTRVRAAAVLAMLAAPAHAQPTMTCASTGPRVECPADTTRGVTLRTVTGDAPCEQDVSWGYDARGIWVKDGCAAEFETGQIEQWGAVVPGQGFVLGKTRRGELYLSMYALFRYLNQMPAGQEFEDHLGRTRMIDARNDIFAHRIMLFFKGWVAKPELVYNLILWTVNTTDQRALFAVLGYQLDRKLSLYVGLNGLPGTRTLIGNHPWWLGHDRVMADEFFRPFFTHGVWASGEPVPGLWYTAMVGNNLSALGITAVQLTRTMAYSGSLWWMPTTHEFGPNGSFDDWEYHDELATRLGACATQSNEDRFSNVATESPDNTTLRLADSVNVFDLGALAPDVTVQQVRYRMFEADAGLKYKGVFVGAAYFRRWLDRFRTDGPIPVDAIRDQGFYVQAAMYPVERQLELYGATSWVFGDESAGFSTSHEYLGGVNWFYAHSRDYRVNAQLIWVDRSPVSSTFGYYVGGQHGPTLAVATSFMF